MASKVSFFSFVFVFTILFTSSCIQFGAAIRPLNEKPLLRKYFLGFSLSALKLGKVPPIVGSPCTYIPGGGGKCVHVNEMNFAGPTVRTPPAFSGNVVDYSVSSSSFMED